MSKQLDQLTQAQQQTATNVAALQTAVANQPKPDDLTGAISAEQANAAAIANLTASLTPAAPTTTA